MKDTTVSPLEAVSHLQPDIWAEVNRVHIAKAISEFAHELIIQPQLEYSKEGWGNYALAVPDTTTCMEYRFRAKVMLLEHWSIDLKSIKKFAEGVEVSLDALRFIIEYSKMMGIPEEVLPTYLEEISSSLYGRAYKQHKKSLTAQELAGADFQQIETSLTEGHPCFVANNGRIGFDANDYRIYAPEAASPLALIWLAGHKSRATYTAIAALDYEKLMEQELGEAVLASFNSRLKDMGLQPEEYVFIPVHPWQWYNKLFTVYAHDIAQGYMVCLGPGPDLYYAQQSIRTFFNISSPSKYYVKTALSIVNMGFMRGLSPYYMRTSPEINTWLYDLIRNDAYLQQTRFSIIREVATVGYRNLYYEEAIPQDTPYKKMVAALWRENPLNTLEPGQRVLSMAALLHKDREGKALLPELIRRSGLAPSAWLSRYIQGYLMPLIHCYYKYDLVFMPHGENLILVLQDYAPVRAIMKDIAEEIAVLNPEAELPGQVKRIAVSAPEPLKILYLFADVFDGFFRYLVEILEQQMDYEEAHFWELVAQCILEYQQAHPEFQGKFKMYDLFAPEFMRTCLNRIQMANNRQMIDLADPTKNLKFAGMQKNPIAAYKNVAQLLPV